MTRAFEPLLADLTARAESYGVRMRQKPLGPETPGEFDGLSVTLNPDYDLESRCYYLAHSLGSIVQWGLDFDGPAAVYGEVRAAKRTKETDPERFAAALVRYLRFEETSSDHAVWLLEDVGHGWAVPGYTVFFRADLESMRRLHTEGVAPVWREFFPRWKERVAKGEQPIEPFRSRPVPPFKPVRIPPQEVVREEDGRP